jgi:hypothetical protein
MNFTIGADPELFLKNSSGKLISSIGLIGGSKQHPKLISENGHAIQEDNVSVEFNIPPCESASAFVDNLNFVLTHLDKRAAELGLQFATNIAAASFPEDQLNCPEAFVFGCEPDFNAWTRRINPRPHADDYTLRSCGGHVHVGTKLDGIAVIRAMDLFLGVPSIFLDPDTKRRELYGKAGAYRSKNYGVEYRTLSNFWIWKDATKKWVYDQTKRALEFVESGSVIPATHGKLIRNAINNGDYNAAEVLGKHYTLAY